MFLINIWSKLKIRNKIFILTSSVILLAGIVLFAGIYSYMPKLYADYKMHEIKTIMETFTTALESRLDYKSVASEFSYNNGVQILIADQNDKILYPNHPIGGNLMSIKSMGRKNKDLIYAQQPVFLEAINQKATIIMTTNFHPIDDATTIIVLFIPFMSAIIIAIAISLAYINAKFLTRPILRINSVAKKVAQLDFSSELAVRGGDEIAELCESINEMSHSLEQNILNLEKSNVQLKSDIEKEREIEKQRREFIATISHELKSPLTIITGQLEGMKLNIGKYKDHDKYLSESLEVAGQMQNLVHEILSLNKLESQELKLQLSRINLSELINELIVKNSYLSVTKPITVNKNIAKNIYLEGDFNLLKRALRNIIENAYLYSTQFVEISLTDDVLRIKNSYTNFPKAELENIFKPFYRIEKSRNRQMGGSGLGLYIVKMILDKHQNLTYKMIVDDINVTFELKIK